MGKSWVAQRGCDGSCSGDVVAQRGCGGTEGMWWFSGDVVAQLS
jgi:hypothetical protein